MAWNNENPTPPSASAASNAPRLRKATTDAEKRLWYALRKELPEISGTHFRRQVAIGPYVADFVCLASRLVIEVDGPVHNDIGQKTRDAQRDAYPSRPEFSGDQVFERDDYAEHAIHASDVEFHIDHSHP